MFDELDKNSALPNTAGAPTGPVKTEDIFADTDKAEKPEVFKPRPAGAPVPYTTVVPEEQTWNSKRGLIFGLLAGSIVIIVGGYFTLKFMANESVNLASQTVRNENEQAEIKKEETKQPEQMIENLENSNVQPTAQTIQVSQPVDSDSDGLTDDEEETIGTSINNADSDYDGLTDREEAKVYKTDPLKSDTDGDGYKDGDELKNGYNPNGAGKLLEINESN